MSTTYPFYTLSADTLAGLALLLFALRYLTESLDREISRYLTSGLQKWTQTSRRALLSGVLATSIVQASSVTIITTMGFLSRGILTLDRSILIMLGAALGSTIKGWFLFQASQIFGPILLLGGVLGRIAARDQRHRRLSEVIISIGMTFLGLQLIETGLGPIAQTEIAHRFFTLSLDDHLLSVLKTVLIGFVASTLLQSSSSVLFLVIGLGNQGLVSIPAGIGILLGANIGTTTTPLIAAIGQEPDAKRLAYTHCLVKILGVGLVLVYFRTHIALVEDLAALTGLNQRPGLLLVAFHTWFNLMNALTWWLLLPLLVRSATGLFPGREKALGTSPFTLRIQNLLESLGGKAISEGISKVQQVIKDLHWVSDSIFHVIESKEENRDCSQLLDESLQKCERTIEVMDTVKHVAWRYLQASEHSIDSKTKVLGVLLLIADLKNLQSVLHSCVQALKYSDTLPNMNEKGAREHFKGMRTQINRALESIYSLNEYSLFAKDFHFSNYSKYHMDVNLFELSLRLRSMQDFLEMRSRLRKSELEPGLLYKLSKQTEAVEDLRPI